MFSNASVLGLDIGRKNALEIANLPNFSNYAYSNETIFNFLEKHNGLINESDKKVIKSRYFS